MPTGDNNHLGAFFLASRVAANDQTISRIGSAESAFEVAQIRAEGAVSLRTIAEALNAQSVPAPKGGRWQATQVQRTIQAAYWHNSNEEWRRARGRS